MNMKRMRGRNHRPNGGGGGGGGGFRNQQNGIPLNRNHVFDSSGPEMRLRGTAQQLHEKYTQLARDASSNGDRVTGEAYYQHAEHYFRIISAINQAAGQNGQPAPQHGSPNGGYQNNGQNDYQNRRPYTQNGPSGNGQIGSANGFLDQDGTEPRAAETRAPEPRGYEPRTHEPRQNYEPRQPDTRPDYAERRHDRPRPAPEQIADARIDISSALEAELAAAAVAAAAAAAPASLPAGAGEQPSLKFAPAIAPKAPAVEPRAIPIAAAPPADMAPARPRPRPDAAIVEAAPADPAPRPRTRGRPRTVKPEPAGD
jgi:hypothetical protein